MGTMRELVVQPTNRFVSVIVAAADLIVFSSYLSTGIEKHLCECVHMTRMFIPRFYII